METPGDRLRQAWKSRGYATARDAARAIGANHNTFHSHSNGVRGIPAKAAERYARFFRVRLEWLLTGKGEAHLDKEAQAIPITGLVGAGAAVEMVGSSDIAPPDWYDLPDLEHLAALVVRGDSQYPRFLDGEVILYDTRPAQARDLIGQYAIVQTLEDGRRLVKKLKRGTAPDRYTLASHNAPDEENVALMGAWRIKAVAL